MNDREKKEFAGMIASTLYESFHKTCPGGLNEEEIAGLRDLAKSWQLCRKKTAGAIISLTVAALASVLLLGLKTYFSMKGDL